MENKKEIISQLLLGIAVLLISVTTLINSIHIRKIEKELITTIEQSDYCND